MALAILTGQCWPRLAERLEAFTPAPEQNIIQIGVRALDPEERLHLESTRIVRIASDEMARLPEALSELNRRTRRVYVHVDADVLDISEGSANSYACDGGLTRATLYQALDLICNNAEIGAASITSYDPGSDSDTRVAQVLNGAFRLLGS
jgi:arginase family enzyme